MFSGSGITSVNFISDILVTVPSSLITTSGSTTTGGSPSAGSETPKTSSANRLEIYIYTFYTINGISTNIKCKCIRSTNVDYCSITKC